MYHVHDSDHVVHDSDHVKAYYAQGQCSGRDMPRWYPRYSSLQMVLGALVVYSIKNSTPVKGAW